MPVWHVNSQKMCILFILRIVVHTLSFNKVTKKKNCLKFCKLNVFYMLAMGFFQASLSFGIFPTFLTNSVSLLVMFTLHFIFSSCKKTPSEQQLYEKLKCSELYGFADAVKVRVIAGNQFLT